MEKRGTLLLLFVVFVASAATSLFSDQFNNDNQDSTNNNYHSSAWKWVKNTLQHATSADDRVVVVVGTTEGILFEYTSGDADVGELVSVGLPSKWVTAAIILQMREEGLLSLSDTPGKYLDFWTNDGGGRSQITLQQLLTCTSGLGREHPCVGNDQYSSLAACAEQVHAANQILPFAPGSTFYYSGNNDVVMGAMALKAAGAVSWNALLDRYIRAPLNIRREALFFLPPNNPSLSEGLFTSTSVYVEFLSEFYNRFIVHHDGVLLAALADKHNNEDEDEKEDVLVPTIVVPTVNYSPLQNKDYRYNMGHWSSAALLHIHPSGYFYPLIDQANDYFVVVKTSTSSAAALMDIVRPSITSAIALGRSQTSSAGSVGGAAPLPPHAVNINNDDNNNNADDKNNIEDNGHDDDDEDEDEQQRHVGADDDEDENILTSDSQILRAKATIALVGTFVLLTMVHLAAN